MREIRQYMRKYKNKFNVHHSSHGYQTPPISKIKANFIKSRLEGASIVDDKAYYLYLYAEDAREKGRYKHRYNNHNDYINKIRYYV